MYRHWTAVRIFLLSALVLIIPVSKAMAHGKSKSPIHIEELYPLPSHVSRDEMELYDKIGGWWPTHAVAQWRGSQLISITRGDPTQMQIALTFDDGPHPPFTQKLLALLKRLHVPATFFLVGWKVDQSPYILRDMLRQGDVVANHTYHHFDLKLVPPSLADNEISLGDDAIERACAVIPRFFRPSGGQFDPAVIADAAQHHLVTVLWTNDPADYVSPGENAIYSRIMSTVRPGSIILLHDGIEQTYDILPRLIANLRAEGYTFVTIAQMCSRLEALHNASQKSVDQTETIAADSRLQHNARYTLPDTNRRKK